MSDRPAKRSRHGAQAQRPYHDGQDRRDRDWRDRRRYDEENGQRRYRSRSRERQRRHRDVEEDDRRERRRQRSRSRERTDRDREFGRRRDEGPSRKGEHDMDREIGRNPGKDGRHGSIELRRGKDKDHSTRDVSHDHDRDQGRQRSASPRRSASPGRGRPNDRETAFPTRPKPEKAANPSAPLSFKMGVHDRERSKGKAGDEDGGADSQDAHDRSRSRGSIEDTHMDENQDDEDVVVEDDGMDAMKAMMGFGGFGSTKGTKVSGNDIGAVRKDKKTEYRQYMNRMGGFNRPLSPSR